MVGWPLAAKTKQSLLLVLCREHSVVYTKAAGRREELFGIAGWPADIKDVGRSKICARLVVAIAFGYVCVSCGRYELLELADSCYPPQLHLSSSSGFPPLHQLLNLT